jgi:Protein of unknown function DUF262/Protein of unknown function (DUF1524)
MNITANGRTIEQVLGGGFFRVPRFQRPYSWDRANVEDFWLDVVESETDYFIGSMVVYPQSEFSGLVDGQQRITTITMMLAAIRNELIGLGETTAASGIQTLVERVHPKGKTRFVLQTQTSYPYLQAQIQAEPGSAEAEVAAGAEEKALEETFGYITSRINGISKTVDENPGVAEARKITEKTKQLLALRDKLLALTVVLVEVDGEDNATIIFQTLNSRGKNLEQKDLVKAHLLSILSQPNEDLDQARDQWEGMIDSFDESVANISMNRFLLHSWLSRKDYVGEKALFKSVKRAVKTNTARSYLDDLLTDADLYRAAHEPPWRQWKKAQLPIRYSLEAMSLFRLQQPLPFVLSLLRAYDEDAIKIKALLRGLRAVENYHFIATAVTNSPSSGGVSRMYSASARAVLDAKTPAEKSVAIDELADKLRYRLPSYAEFEASFMELRSSRQHTQQTPLVRYVLTRLHAATVQPETTIPIDYDQLTVEHLAFQGQKKTSNVSPGDIARIGNLLLITQKLNDDLADKPFSEKQKVLKDQPGVDAEILSAKKWGGDEIVQRTKRLAKRAYDDVWTF